MAEDTSEAREELRAKMALEVELRRLMDAYNANIVAAVADVNDVTSTANINDTFGAQLTAILFAHYLLTMGKFDKEQRRKLPTDVAATVAEDAAIRRSLTTYFTAQAPQHANIINTTTQRDLSRSLIEAVVALTDEGAVVSPNALAATTSRLLGAKLNGRTTTIVTTETEFPAETSKATELSVLAGSIPQIEGGQVAEVQVDKIWVTVADGAVRPSHSAADGQRVNETDAFIVGGSRLGFPGDLSMGASLNEVMGCRCAAVYDTNQLVALRRRKDEEPFLEVG